MLQAQNPVRESTGKPVARGEERNRETIPTPWFARRPSTMNSSFCGRRSVSGELHGWSIKTSDLWASIWRNPRTFDVFMLEDKIQNPSKCLFQFSLRSNVMDQRSGLLWTRTSWTPTSRKRSVWRNRKLRKRTVSFAEDRSLTWSTTTFELLVLMMQFLTMPIYSPSLFATMMFRNLIRDGMKSYCLWPRSHLMTSWKVCTNLDYVSLINSKPYLNCMTLKFIRKFDARL